MVVSVVTVVVVAIMFVVVDVVVVVLLVVAQPPSAQAEVAPAAGPWRRVDPAFRETGGGGHDATPRVSLPVPQHVTLSCRPHVDRPAHSSAARRQAELDVAIAGGWRRAAGAHRR